MLKVSLGKSDVSNVLVGYQASTSQESTTPNGRITKEK